MPTYLLNKARSSQEYAQQRYETETAQNSYSPTERGAFDPSSPFPPSDTPLPSISLERNLAASRTASAAFCTSFVAKDLSPSSKASATPGKDRDPYPK
mmetsp:Transcript_11689/g.34364  ORF Transcript_11689/g.34364 Transcript_11689/m.34364 type:complete len:98 (+) Transcript_11689:73-366(+)